MRRKMMGRWVIGMIAFWGVVATGEETLYGWKGNEALRGWAAHPHQCRVVEARDGALTVETTGWDPFLTGPAIELPATVAQSVRFRARTRVPGRGELFWVPEGKSVPIQAWSAAFEWIGDGEWHDYRILPFWQGAGKVIAFRIDFPNGMPAGSRYEIADIQIVEEARLTAGKNPMPPLSQWRRDSSDTLESPFFSSPVEALPVLSFTAKTRAPGAEAQIEWITDDAAGIRSRRFRIPGDGEPHVFVLDLIEEGAGMGNLVWLRATPLAGEGTVALTAFALSEEMPAVPADLVADWAGMADGVNRAGMPVPIGITLRNIGTCDADRLSVALDPLPDGVETVGDPVLPVIPGQAMRTARITLRAERPVTFTAGITVTGGRKPLRVTVPVTITERFALPKADYVPQPRPLKGDYEIGALYFPGWSDARAWQRIWKVAPERKPLLGWYDEGNPEVVDWQIKWAVENGISYFLVDWYWDRGRQHLDHWVKAFQKARYRSYLKWAVMWANHNGEGSHSEADQRAVTRFWIDHYFGMPEYLH
ncbi:MAG: hypothetical protein J6334_06080, partial [Kiritimatiellae bacterium]|nr:hypothetical protein [Kiritimatiellia bacterium]